MKQEPSGSLSAETARNAAVEAEASKARLKKIEAETKAKAVSGSTDMDVHDVRLRFGSRENWHPYEGVGALSAGASSRLLQDYPVVQRSEILDLLFKPKYGASLQVLKVEIGGDMQSTDGSEPSHMRFKGEKPDCSRGYETWLMKEAKARNPRIRTYALAWGVPGWIGDGNFFSTDNIVYHVSWLKCIRDTYGFHVDYIGVWNEMPWGDVWYIEELAKAIAAEKLQTRLVLLDEVKGVSQGFIDRFNANATFRNMVDAVGLHYPCTAKDNLMKALSHRKQTRFWASEELSTVADWGGAGCWGRMINQNFIRMNATSSIAWSLVWSAYPNLECFGNGLLYAFEPWSGHFGVMPPIWTSAHTTQFTEVGWHYLPVGDGAGLLPKGGTFVTILSDDERDFTVVVETLQGQCFYHGGCFHDQEATAPQKVRFHFVGGNKSLETIARDSGSLEVWMTNQTHLFEPQDDVQVDVDGTVTLVVPADAIVTLTTRRGASKQGKQNHQELAVSFYEHDAFGGVIGKSDLKSSPFPLPYSEPFDFYNDVRMPKYFADQGGAFEVIKPPFGSNPRPWVKSSFHSFHVNGVLEQQVLKPPIAWGHSPEPMTLLGDVNWTDIGAEVMARFGHRQNGTVDQKAPSRHVGLCVRLSRYHFFGQGPPEGYCLQVVEDDSGSSPTFGFRLLAAATVITGGPVPAGTAKRALENGWLRLRLRARGARLQGSVDGEEVVNMVDTMLPFGQVALECGYHRCQFDDLKLSRVPPLGLSSAVARGTVSNTALALLNRRMLVRRAQLAQFVYNSRSCDPAPRTAGRRIDFTGLAGFAFKTRRPLLVKGLGRLKVSGGHPWARIHNISIYMNSTRQFPIASVALTMDPTNQVGIEETEEGWIFAELREPIRLSAGTTYFLVSSELANGDAFYDKSVHVDFDSDAVSEGPVYLDNSGWQLTGELNQGFGPLNALLETFVDLPTKAPHGDTSPMTPFGKTHNASNATVPFGKTLSTISKMTSSTAKGGQETSKAQAAREGLNPTNGRSSIAFLGVS